jgi:hypothetical protein
MRRDYSTIVYWIPNRNSQLEEGQGRKLKGGTLIDGFPSGGLLFIYGYVSKTILQWAGKTDASL